MKDKPGRDSPLRTPGWVARDAHADSYLYGVPTDADGSENSTAVRFGSYGRDESGSFPTFRRHNRLHHKFDRKVQLDAMSGIAKGDLKPSAKVNSGYLYRQRWIWKVDYKSSLSSIVEALASLRLSEGFFILSTDPVYSFFTQIPIESPVSKEIVNSFLQYIFYVRHGVLVTELWYEPQHGTVTLDTERGTRCFGTDSLWNFLKQNFREVDGVLISSLCTFDELVQTLNETVGGSNLISLNKEKDISRYEEFLPLLEQNIPYTEIILSSYDADSLLKKATPREEHYPCWDHNPSSPLYSFLHSALVKHSDATLVENDLHQRRQSNPNLNHRSSLSSSRQKLPVRTHEPDEKENESSKHEAEAHTKTLRTSTNKELYHNHHHHRTKDDYGRYRHVKGISETEMVVATLQPAEAKTVVRNLSKSTGEPDLESPCPLNQAQELPCSSSNDNLSFLVNYHRVTRQSLLFPSIRTEIPALIASIRRDSSCERMRSDSEGSGEPRSRSATPYKSRSIKGTSLALRPSPPRWSLLPFVKISPFFLPKHA